jgi:hypothetical protein
MEQCASEEYPARTVAVEQCSEDWALWGLLDIGHWWQEMKTGHTQKNIMKVSRDVIHVTVLVENSLNW